jgi:hypothetical protein
MRGARGFWSMATLGVAVAAVGMAGYLAFTLRRERRGAVSLSLPAARS